MNIPFGFIHILEYIITGILKSILYYISQGLLKQDFLDSSGDILLWLLLILFNIDF